MNFFYENYLNFCKTRDNNKYLIGSKAYDKIYDIIPTDWIEAAFRRDDNPQKTSRFWCSALVGYIYTQCGCLHPGTDWSMIRPSDFVEDYLQYINDIELSELTELN